MSTPKAHRGADADSGNDPSQGSGFDGNLSGAPPTYATFSPVTLAATTPSRSSRQSTIIVHQKSPLLLATPPQITRALAYSHPFLLPLNKLAGLLTWTTDDPWESFLLLASFWAIVLYGDIVVRMAGPIVVVLALILGMYGRRFSPLSSSGWTEPASKDPGGTQNTGGGTAGAKAQKSTPKSSTTTSTTKGHQRGESEATNTRHQKTLDEIVETLKEFTGRCNLLLEPLLELTDFLSTQRTPTSATTRPALTTLFVRILFCTPFWMALTLPPLRIITTRRVALLFGTLVLTWHARFLRVARTLLWRSATIRRTAALVTGLTFEKPVKAVPVQITAAENGKVQAKPAASELTKALRKQSHRHGNNATSKDAGVKFTFIIYENQRRWVGLGWTQSMFAYERSAWTDEHNNPVPSRDTFELPEVEDGSNMRWRWVERSKWRVDGVPDDGTEPIDYDGEPGKNGWIYYDNKWQNGRRGSDGWGRWTRRRKWYRDAELVEVSEDEMAHELDASQAPSSARPGSPTTSPPGPALTTQRYSTLEEKMVSPTRSAQDLTLSDKDLEREKDDTASTLSTSSGGRSFFKAPSLRRKVTDKSVASKADKEQDRSRRASEAKSEEEAAALGLKLNLALQGKEGGQWGIGDEARMSLE
ncbi:integral peroxisomal membrane peroxin [Colletotrichum nymphaeae SA-01]|uniref:Integral peroxisomal membrane peroxin n=1 Tax=Colletotrichum nymphaeae SA-01 TaxID=1460502 RepID=A0A135T5X5_9PEZI|nr:integral peroxisomal membrane peroxin [Colletotrichum nymphaeae SA-01]